MILIPTVCALAALFGWKMCRLASLSDEAETAAMAEWIDESGLRRRTSACEQRPRPEARSAMGWQGDP